VRTEETLKSSGQELQETGVFLGSAFKATNLIHFCPYKVTFVHELKCIDPLSRIQFCIWMLQNVHDGLIDPQLHFLTDKAYSTLHQFNTGCPHHRQACYQLRHYRRHNRVWFNKAYQVIERNWKINLCIIKKHWSVNT
jgi:hypothetical protein